MDHACWERPEDMDTPRSVFKVDKKNPGSDIAGEIAAALAAASIVFLKCDPSYSNLLLQRAITVNNERKIHTRILSKIKNKIHTHFQS